MPPVKAKIAEAVSAQPEDATYEEIVRELAFERMVERGLNDARTGRIISDEEMWAWTTESKEAIAVSLADPRPSIAVETPEQADALAKRWSSAD